MCFQTSIAKLKKYFHSVRASYVRVKWVCDGFWVELNPIFNFPLIIIKRYIPFKIISLSNKRTHNYTSVQFLNLKLSWVVWFQYISYIYIIECISKSKNQPFWEANERFVKTIYSTYSFKFTNSQEKQIKALLSRWS